MTINPIARTNAATATYTNTATPAATSANAQVWGQDEYVPSVEGSPYPSYPNVEDTPPQSRDELFATIVKKHGGGANGDAFFSMLGELMRFDLVTEKEYASISHKFMCQVEEARNRLNAQEIDFRVFMQTFLVSFEDILMDLVNDRTEYDKKMSADEVEKHRASVRDFYIRVSEIAIE